MPSAHKETTERALQDWQTTDVIQTPMEVCWQFDYAIEVEKLEVLYKKAKQRQGDADERLDWTVEIDPSKPIIDRDENRMRDLSFFKKLSKSQQEAFTAH